MACSRAMVAMIGLVVAALLFPAAFSSMRPDQLISMTTDGQYHSTLLVVTISDGLTADYHDASCPDLWGIVRTAVVEALQGDLTIAADLLRMFFHDCFLQSGGQTYHVPLGRLNSFKPAPLRFVEELPPPPSALTSLAAFSSRNLNKKDLVVLSGVHTIGKARCTTFGNRLPNSNSDDFVHKLQDNCTADAHRCQDVDVTTPARFDNKCYINVKEGKGMLISDVQLLINITTRGYVNDFVDNEWWLWNQFSVR
ncbi:hypothetical protein VPH35_033156 [Triticum aestivum]